MKDFRNPGKKRRRQEENNRLDGWAPLAWSQLERVFVSVKEQPCPYLPDRKERKLIAPLISDSQAELTHFNKAGFRRSHDLVYTTICDGCQGCKSIRVPVANFKPSKTQRRILKANADLRLRIVRNFVTQEHWELFEAYVKQRHAMGDMANMDRADFASMVEDTKARTSLFEWRDPQNTELRAACLVDHLDDGFSAVYSFFDPDYAQNSLGSWIILSLINSAQAVGLPFVYLGYLVQDSAKMAYKQNFKPFEIYDQSEWKQL